MPTTTTTAITSDLFSSEVVSVMHVLVLAKICRYLTNFCIELYIDMLFLSEQNGMLNTNII